MMVPRTKIETLRSGELARRAGVHVETLRYYEQRGLLAVPARSGSRYRAYGPDAISTVRFIKRAQLLGFTLADIHALLRLAAGEPASCGEARRLATCKIGELQSRIDSLQAMQRSLEELVRTCDRPAGGRECPLLQSMEECEQSQGEP